MLSHLSGPKVLIATIVIWAISNLIFQSDHAPIEQEANILPVATIAETTPMQPQPELAVVDTKAADPQPLMPPPMSLDTNQPSTDQHLIDASSQAVIAALKAATATLDMAADTLKLIVAQNAALTLHTAAKAKAEAEAEAEAETQSKTTQAAVSHQAAAIATTGDDSVTADRPPKAVLPPSSSSDPKRYLAQARQAAWQGSYREALAHFQMAVSLAPENSAIHGEFGNLLYKIGHWPEAVEQFIIAADLHLAANEHQRAAELLPILQQLAPARAAKFKARLMRSRHTSSDQG